MAEWKKMLIAIDEEETSLKALHYVGRMARDIHLLSICLLHVYPAPPPDFFQRGGVLEEYSKNKKHMADRLFYHAAQVLVQYGIDENKLEYRCLMADGRTISETVLQTQKEGEFGTVVVGKRGVSRAEEFIFGSISNALARSSKDFSAWIVG